MIKIIIRMFVVLILLLPGISVAAPCYGPKMPEQNKLFAGVQTYSVLDRNLEKNQGEISSLQHFFLLSYGLTDWLSVDFKGGAGNISQEKPGQSDLDYSSYMSGGYGFRIKFLDKEKFDAVFGFQHISVHPYVVWEDNLKNKSVLDDWQLSLLASYKLQKVRPYMGVKLSRMDYIHWIDENRDRVRSDTSKSVGVFIGTDINFSDKVWLNIEGQFVDVSAFSTSLNYKF